MDNQPRAKIDLNGAPWVGCEDNKLFEPKLMFKKVSALISPTGREEHVPVEMIVCSKCGKVPKFFYEKLRDIPEELKSNCEF